jgi:hypothetical protein
VIVVDIVEVSIQLLSKHLSSMPLIFCQRHARLGGLGNFYCYAGAATIWAS